MRVLILGGEGMLGHKLTMAFPDQEVHSTCRGKANSFEPVRWIEDFNALDPKVVENALNLVNPDLIINCIGWIKQRTEVDPIEVLKLNSCLPKQLAKWTDENRKRMIHLSTDCVFTGLKGKYSEQDLTDAQDLYGISKYLGETANSPHVLSLRTSMIGLELKHKKSLIEWYLEQKKSIQGYSRAIFSGFTTQALSRVLFKLGTQKTFVPGLYHLASQPISKFDLLSRLNQRLGVRLEIKPETSFFCDRSLDGSKLVLDAKIEIPTWDLMLDELAEEIRQREERNGNV